MNESISFYLASGERHPDEKELQRSAFSQLIAEQLQKHDEAFGKDLKITFHFPDNEGCVKFNVQVFDGFWTQFYKAGVSLDAFSESDFSEDFKKQIVDYFNGIAEEVVLTKKV